MKDEKPKVTAPSAASATTGASKAAPVNKANAGGQLRAVEATVARIRQRLEGAAEPGGVRPSHDECRSIVDSLVEVETILGAIRDVLSQ